MKSSLQISSKAHQKVSQAIVISGSSRSGTTILGKLVHSFVNVEYAFEPPVLFSLFALIEQLPMKQWQLLYETYLYEEFLINAVSGRNINCNQADDSSIYNAKPADIVRARLSSSLGKREAEKVCLDHIIAYKIPDVVPFLPKLARYYPLTRFIILRRGANETLNSLIAKKWFSNDNRDQNLIWPFNLYKDHQIPFWVKEDDYDEWVGMSEVDRCAYYYVRVNEAVDELQERIEIKYGELLVAPTRVVKQLADRLNVSFGEKTPEIIATIKPTAKERDSELLNQINIRLLDSVRYYSSISEYK